MAFFVPTALERMSAEARTGANGRQDGSGAAGALASAMPLDAKQLSFSALPGKVWCMFPAWQLQRNGVIPPGDIVSMLQLLPRVLGAPGQGERLVKFLFFRSWCSSEARTHATAVAQSQ